MNIKMRRIRLFTVVLAVFILKVSAQSQQVPLTIETSNYSLDLLEAVEKVVLNPGFKVSSEETNFFKATTTSFGGIQRHIKHNHPTESNVELLDIAYPNPFRDILNIKISEGSVIEHVLLFDKLGRVHIEEKDWNKKQKTLNTKEIPVGVYFLKFTCNSQDQTVKVLKLMNAGTP